MSMQGSRLFFRTAFSIIMCTGDEVSSGWRDLHACTYTRSDSTTRIFLRACAKVISWARLSFFAEHAVRLVRGDREFEVSIGRSYSTEQLSRMFNVDPGSIWLRSRYGNEVYFPNPEGVFDLPSERVLPYAEFSVEGESMTRHLQGQASAQSSAGQANAHTPVMQRTPGPSNYHGSPAAMPFTSVVNATGQVNDQHLMNKFQATVSRAFKQQ